MEPVKVVAHFIDDIIVKGHFFDFDPESPSCMLYQENNGRSLNHPVVLEMKEIKALFFVKSFDGNKDYRERKEFLEGDHILGRRMELTFIDGEKLRGSTLDYDPRRRGFFLIPVDPDSNNIQVFVVSNAVMNVTFL
jgi:hypothetical protein